MSSKGRKKKTGLPHHSEKVRAIAVIRVGPGVDSIRYALQSCLESNIRTIYIVDDAYSPNAPIYTEKSTKKIMKHLNLRRTVIHIAPTLDIDDFEKKNPSRSKDDILMFLPHDCYVVKGVVTKTVEYIGKTYKDYDHYSIAPQTEIKFSLWNGLIFALFMFDWFRSLVNRFQIHENTHVRFVVLKRKLGHPIIPKGTWWGGVNRHSYTPAGSGACLHPSKSGLEYFLYLLYSHTRIGIGAFVLFQFAWTVMVGFPFYNWMPIVNQWLNAVDTFGRARLILWFCHGLVAVAVTNKYFNEKSPSPGRQLQWVHAFLIPLWISFPMFPILVTYGRFLYRGYRAPPPPPDITPPKLARPSGGRPKRKNGDPKTSPPPASEEEEEGYEDEPESNQEGAEIAQSDDEDSIEISGIPQKEEEDE